MIRLSKFIQNYLLWAFPFVAVCATWGTLVGKEPTQDPNLSGFMAFMWEVLSYNLMFWFAMLMFFFLLLVIHSGVREQTLKRISNIKDRDEREEQITGRASKRAYISTFAFLIMLLFLSVFDVKISQIPTEEQVAGKTRTLSIGMGFEIFDKPEIKSSADGHVIFEAKDIPLSKSSIILLVLGWLIVSYNLNVRRELNL